MIVDGGLFSGTASIDRITDYNLTPRYELTKENENYLKKIKKSWIMMNTEIKNVHEVFLTNGKNYWFSSTRGFLGDDTSKVLLKHFGFGNAGYKRDKALAENGLDFQPYISNASGNLVGVVETTSKFSYDPSNFGEYMKCPVSGTFSIRFNKSITNLIKGTNDWKVIDSRILNKFKYDAFSEEEAPPAGYQYWKTYDAEDVYEK